MASRFGFTLVEIMVVLLIGAMIATAVSLNLHGVHRNARMEDIADGLVYFDRVTRQHARRFDQPAQLLFDLQAGTVQCLDAKTQQPQRQAFNLPDGYAFEKLVLSDRQIRDSDVTVPYSSHGRSPTYAVLIAYRNQYRRWLVVGGLTGQPQTIEHEQDVKNIFAALSARRHDAG